MNRTRHLGIGTVTAFLTIMVVPNIAFAHTQTYWTGYNQGKLNRENGTHETPIDMCNSADLAGIDAQHCVAGYNDGYNGVNPATTEGPGPSSKSTSSSSLSESVHCDTPGWPSCYDVGSAAGHRDGYVDAHNGLSYQNLISACHGHSNNWCTGFFQGSNDGYYSFARHPGHIPYGQPIPAS